MSCQNDNKMNNVGKTNVEKMINEGNSEQQGKTNKVKIISKQEFKKLKAASYKKPTTENISDIDSNLSSEALSNNSRLVTSNQKAIENLNYGTESKKTRKSTVQSKHLTKEFEVNPSTDSVQGRRIVINATENVNAKEKTELIIESKPIEDVESKSSVAILSKREFRNFKSELQGKSNLGRIQSVFMNTGNESINYEEDKLDLSQTLNVEKSAVKITFFHRYSMLLM